MFPIPAAAEPLVQSIRCVFTRPTFQRFILLMSGLIVTMGRRTVSHSLRSIESQLNGHWSDYHRLYSNARYSMWKLSLALARQVVSLLPADQPIILVGDDTVDGKDGDCVWAKGAHRDSVRSSRSVSAVKFGHKWLVLCVLVRFARAARLWALPILCGLCISLKTGATLGKRQKTPSQLARQLLIRMMRWFPERKFILLGDFQVISHATACFAQRHRDRVTVVGRLRGDANLYGYPKRRGRAKKGRKHPSPCQRIKHLKPTTQQVQWYGSVQRTLSYVSETGLWFNKNACQVTPIRWVCVLGDPKHSLPDAYFFTSDTTMPAAQIIEWFAKRWNIEVTFEETRTLLGLETTRHWCKQSVLRVTPILLGLFTAISLIWNQLPKPHKPTDLSQTPCYHKEHPTFADALYAVRRELWDQVLLRHQAPTRCLSLLPRQIRNVLLWHLAAAA